MKIFRQFLILFFLLIQFNLKAQIENGNKNWIIKGNVTSLVDYFTFPTTRVSVERSILNHFSVTAEAGIQLFRGDTAGIIRFYGKGYKANIEGRYYPFNPNGKNLSGLYIGLQYFVRQNHYPAEIDYFKSNNPDTITDYFNVNKTAYGLNFILGLQFPVGKRVVFDIYSGIGSLNREIINTDREYLDDEDDKRADYYLYYSPDNKHLSETSGKSLNLLIGFRIGFAL